MPDLYSILELSATATQEEIKVAYKRLAKKYHPDRNPGNIEAEENFKQLSRAYSILSDPDLRSRYDEWNARQDEEKPHADPRYRRRSQYTPPPQQQHSPINYGRALLLFGGGLIVFGLIIWFAILQLSKYDARKKYAEGYSAYYLEGSQNRAINLLSVAIYRDPYYAPPYLLLAEIMIEQKEYRQALYQYEKAYTLEHFQEAKHYFNQAIAQYELGDAAQAYQTLSKGFQIKPDNWKAQRLAGDIALHHTHQIEAAMAHYNAVLKAQPNHSHALLGLGIALHHKQEYALSNEKLVQVNVQEPSEGKALYYMALNQLKGAQDAVTACKLFEGAYMLGVMEAKWEMSKICPP